MASVYTNDLRLEEIGSGEQSGTWGDTTNTNLELIAEGFSFGTEAITTNADTHTSTVADGATDPARSMYIKYTGTLDSTCTITIAPNTLSRMHFIENGTSGSQNIIISQGSGANVTIPSGDVKAVYLDGAGSGAAVVDAFASLNVVDLKVQDDLTVTDDVAIGGLATIGGTLGVTGIATFTDDIIIGDGKTIGSASDVDAMTIASNGQVTFTQTLIGTALDISGDIDVDGTANLDIVDIDGAVDMASTLAVAGVVTANAGVVVDEMTIDGDTLTATDTFTIDATGDITLDSAGADIFFSAAGNVGSINMASNNLTLESLVSGADTIFKGNVGGTSTTAMTLDYGDNASVFIANKLRKGFIQPNSAFVQTASAHLNYWKLGRIYTYGPGGAKLVLYGKAGYSTGGNNEGETILLMRGTTSATALDGLFETRGAAGTSSCTAMGYVPVSGSDYTFDIYAALGNFHSLDHEVVTSGTWETSVSNTGSTSAPTGYVGFTVENNVVLGSVTSHSYTQSSFYINNGVVDMDFRVSSDGNTNMLFVDGSADTIGIGTTEMNVVGNNTAGINFLSDGMIGLTRAGVPLKVNRTGDGDIVEFYSAAGKEGTISISGSTTSYNGFSGLHESSGILTNTPVGTVVSTIDELDVYAAMQGSGTEQTPSPKAGQTRADHAKVKVSDTAGDACVYGVVGSFNAQDKVNVVSVGIGSVRVTGACAKGDLLESNGDGTAKVQSDDIVRSKTIGKVTIGNSNTGVKLVSCVMYCG
jgi:prepilin-type processing-associated H-X9-DG protein